MSTIDFRITDVNLKNWRCDLFSKASMQNLFLKKTLTMIFYYFKTFLKKKLIFTKKNAASLDQKHII